MGENRPGLEQQNVGKAAFTMRSVVLGAVMCILVGLIGPYWTFYQQSSTLFLDYSVGGVMFLLFVLVLILNGLFGLIGRGVGLRSGEMVVVTAMMLVGGGITTMGLTGYMVTNITEPY